MRHEERGNDDVGSGFGKHRKQRVVRAAVIAHNDTMIARTLCLSDLVHKGTLTAHQQYPVLHQRKFFFSGTATVIRRREILHVATQIRLEGEREGNGQIVLDVRPKGGESSAQRVIAMRNVRV